MQSFSGLSGDAAALAREHEAVLDRLPATVRAFILVELQKWPALFMAERRYQQALLEHLSGLPALELRQAVAGVLRIEAAAGIGRGADRDAARFQDDAQALLRKRRLVSDWRREIDGFFQAIGPALDRRLYPDTAPGRVIVQLYGGDIAIQPARMWHPFKNTGVRLRLDLAGANATGPFLSALFGRIPGGDTSGFFASIGQQTGFEPYDAWIVESHAALHELLDGGSTAPPDPALAGLSYDKLQPYRDALMRALYQKIQDGVESPQAFAAYARSLTITPPPGAMLQPAELMQRFARDVFLTGNGTLFVNNTFVEWASVQALRRARPRLLVTRYGVRDRLKPFSSLLLFSQPRETDRIPLIEDPVGSFIDVEQLSYYVWLNAEKSPAYRGKTLYLFLAEGLDEMLAIRSDGRPIAAPAGPVTLADVRATMAAWLGVEAQGGRVIEALSAS